MKRSFIKIIALCIVSIALIYCCCEIGLGEAYCNFDAHVWFHPDTTNDFHLDIHRQGKILDTVCIPLNTKIRNWSFSTEDICWGKRLKWSFSPFLDSCKRVHFGFKYQYIGCTLPLCAVWTNDGWSVAHAPFPLPLWNHKYKGKTLYCYITMQKVDPCCGCGEEAPYVLHGPFEIGRSWAGSKNNVYLLRELTWDNPALNNLTWHNDPNYPFTLNEGGTSPRLDVKCASKYEAVLVKYWVYSSAINDTVYRFVTQIEIK